MIGRTYWCSPIETAITSAVVSVWVMVTKTSVTPSIAARCAAVPRRIDPGLAAAGDLDVGPSDSAPSGAKRLHHRFLSGKAGGIAPGRIGEARGVFPLMLGKAALGEPGDSVQHRCHLVDVGQIHTEANDLLAWRGVWRYRTLDVRRLPTPP